MKRRLPIGEDTLPIAEFEGRYITPTALIQLKYMGSQSISEPTARLLIERVRRRIEQDREGTALSLSGLYPELSPEQILEHMELGDEEGQKHLLAERKWLEESIKILEAEYGSLQ